MLESLQRWQADASDSQRGCGCLATVLGGFVSMAYGFGHSFGDYIGPQPMPPEVRFAAEMGYPIGTAGLLSFVLAGLWLTQSRSGARPSGCASVGGAAMWDLVAVLATVDAVPSVLVGVVGCVRWLADDRGLGAARSATLSAAFALMAVASVGVLSFVVRQGRRARRTAGSSPTKS